MTILTKTTYQNYIKYNNATNIYYVPACLGFSNNNVLYKTCILSKLIMGITLSILPLFDPYKTETIV